MISTNNKVEYSNQNYKMNKQTKADSSNTLEESFQEAMNSYKELVEDRIKNGEPSYQIGGSSMTVKEWDKLITKVDTSIDQIKKELRERVEVLKERDKVQKELREDKEEREKTRKELEADLEKLLEDRKDLEKDRKAAEEAKKVREGDLENVI